MKLLLICVAFVLLQISSAQDQTLLTSDYLLSLLQGAKLNKYVEGSLMCASLIRDSQYDIVSLKNYYQMPRPTDPRLRLEQAYFNTTG